MKKVIFILSLATVLSSCGGSSTESTTIDSTNVDSTIVDSTKTDSTAVVDSSTGGGELGPRPTQHEK